MARTPMPKVDVVGQPFWEACNEERVLIQHCTAKECGRYVYFPRVCCPHCNRDSLEWKEVPGSGKVVSYTLIHRPHHESFYPDAPFLFSAVQLDEGPIVYARLTAVSDQDFLIGRRVRPVFRPYTPKQKLLTFAVEPSV